MARKVGLVLAVAVVLAVVAGANARYMPEDWVDALEVLRADFVERNGAPQRTFVEMRDGVELSTVVYVPRRANDTERLPVVMDRSPYGHIGTEMITLLFARLGFVAVMQNLRGSRGSEGLFSFWRTDGEDTEDTLNWISAQPWSDNQAFQVGISADGNAAIAGGRFSPEQLKGQMIVLATGQGHKTSFQGGVWTESLLEGWLGALGFDYTIEDVLANEAWTDEYWQPIEISMHPGVCSWPTVHWAGWFDIFQEGTIESWKFYQSEESGCPGRSSLVVDPCGHCTLKNSPYPSSRTILPFLQAMDIFVREANNPDITARWEESGLAPDADVVTFYVMGATNTSTIGNYWTTLPDFPETSPLVLYLTESGSLQRTPASSSSGSLTFDYDPRDPVPSNGGNNLIIPCGRNDQSENESRDDVLVFTDSETAQSASVVVGNVRATLFVETSANDTDFTVMLTDYTAATGESVNVLDSIIRLQWRESKEVPVPAVPGEIYEVVVDLGYIAYVLEAGHAFRVDVSSSNYPRFNANDNNGGFVRDQPSRQSVVATNTVHLSSTYPSRIELPMASLDQLPRNYDITKGPQTMDALVEAIRALP